MADDDSYGHDGTALSLSHTVECVRLTSGEFTNAGDARSIRALLFGAMLDRAQSVVEHYRSDLFRDALWIENYVSGETTFYWMVRSHGTHIGSELGAAYRTFGGDRTNVTYKMTLRNTRRGWELSFEVLPADLAPEAPAYSPNGHTEEGTGAAHV